MQSVRDTKIVMRTLNDEKWQLRNKPPDYFVSKGKVKEVNMEINYRKISIFTSSSKTRPQISL